MDLNNQNSFLEIEEQLTSEMKLIEREALTRYSIIKDKESSIHSLHGTISFSKPRNINLILSNWANSQDFIAGWLQGLKDKLLAGEKTIMKKLITDDVIRKYILLFLERDFFRHYKQRVRVKPQENLWSIWFGNSTLFWGLLISPRLTETEWGNKPSDIRKVQFEYWTIRHILTVGIVDPENNKIIKFENLEAFLVFYESILKRVSNSIYEKRVFDFYCNYLRKSENPLDEPLLIPEFRYLGLEKNHKYRLDFIILNSSTGERIGFEFSPQSTHMAIEGIRTKTQTQLNADLLKKWNKEMNKRNEYFQEYGITTITYTDEILSDISVCEQRISYYLSKRNNERCSVDDLISQILQINH